MIELELLGVSPDGETLSLNDADGNRYSLAITDRLRATLRKDIPVPTTEPKPITPREIQAMFRAGHELNDVAQLSSLPATQLLALEHPIAAERSYMAQQARSYRQAHELGGLTVEELVISRLVERGVGADGISWDAYRETGAPWILCASYCVGGNDLTALWQINTKSQSVTALNDEATWLTETAVPAPSAPWRAHNTPKVGSLQQHADPFPRHTSNTADSNDAHMNHEPSAIPLYMRAEETVDSEENTAHTAHQSIDIDSVLAQLDNQRGKARPMPEYDDDEDETSDAEDNADQKKNTSSSSGATIVQFPGQQHLPGMGLSSEKNSDDDSSQSHEHSLSDAHSKSQGDSSTHSHKNKKRRNRPTMPSWDEIVFGYSKNDHSAE